MPKSGYENKVRFNLDTNLEIIIKFVIKGEKKEKIVEEAITLRNIAKNQNIATIDCCHNKPYHLHKYKKGVRLKKGKKLKDVDTRNDARDYLDKNKDKL